MGRHQIDCDTAPAVECDIAGHCSTTAAVPMTNSQSVGVPAHRPHARAVPAVIVAGA